MSKQRKARPGKAIQWSDADLEQLAKVTPQDIEEASALWKRAAQRPLRGLFDAPSFESQR